MATGSPARPRPGWKGKEKATEDFEDLNPGITYRHLHSTSLGVRDPLRVIALCDSDAFYAACEMVRLGVTDKPLVVLQWESLIAVNYPARKFGISRMDKLKDAKARCPELMVVHVATYKEGMYTATSVRNCVYSMKVPQVNPNLVTGTTSTREHIRFVDIQACE
jgi:DNA polymerase eta